MKKDPHLRDLNDIFGLDLNGETISFFIGYYLFSPSTILRLECEAIKADRGHGRALYQSIDGSSRRKEEMILFLSG